jgi:hypothetical protein
MTTIAPHGSGCSRGVALVEVLAAIFIMGVGLLAVLSLFPLGLLSMRQAIQEDRASRSLDRLARAAATFTSLQGVAPRSLRELTPLLDGDDRYSNGADSGYLFVLEGERVTAIPAAPGKTGVRRFCTMSGQVYDCTRSEDVRLARASARRLRLNLLLSAGASAANLLQSNFLSVTGTWLRPSPSPSAATESAFDQLDANRNGILTFREILRVTETDTPVGRFFDSVRMQLDLGAGDEDIDRLPGMSKAAVVGQASSVWSISMVRDLTAFLVSDEATRSDLDQWLRSAELAEASGDAASRTTSLNRYVERVERAGGDTVTSYHSSVLETLARLSGDWR